MKKKIAFIGPLPPPLGGVAIMNQSFQNLLNETYDILSFNTSTGNEREDLYNLNFGKKIIPQVRKIRNFIRFAADDSFEISNLFVTSGVGFIREALFILVLIHFNKKIIVHLHSKKTGEFFLSDKMIRIFAFFINKTNKIIVLSKDHQKYFSRYFEKGKMTVIENFVDYEKFNCEIKDKKKEFLYVGRLSVKKGFFDLLEGISILKRKGLSLKFHIIGVPENSKVENEIKNFIEKNEIAKFLIFHGLKYDSEKYKLFRQCSYFVFPSQFENSPIVLKEAIASKMAIISSNIEANNMILDNLNVSVFFKSMDSKDLAKKIEYLYHNHEKSVALMRAGSQINYFDKNIAKTKLITLIDQI